ncbi:MAG: SprB repeat-containing protein, partial [Sediminibacterium sp.]|nr:SprB repeat-containing protein [Sediminibacterium sp.]
MKRILLLLNVVLLLCINDMFSQAGVTFPVTGITTFANPTNTTLATSGPCVPSKTASAAGWSLSVASSSNCAIIWVGAAAGTDGHINTNATPGGFQWLGVTYGSVDGSEFKLEQLNIATTSAPMTGFGYVFNGYRNGALVAGASLTSAPIAVTGVTNGITVTFTNNAAFNNIDEFRVVPTNASAQGNLFMLDITVATAIAPCITPTLNVASSLNVLCNGASTGSAAVTASGGPSYTYTWSPSGGNAASATALSAGNYTCTVTNSCGATATTTVAITQPPALILTALSSTNVSCNGGNNGAASVNPASGGAGGYTYNWTPGNPPGDGTTNVTGLVAGTWSCTVTDANSCTRTQTFNIVAPPTLNLSPLSQTNVSCNGGNNGAASVNPASGGSGGYTYNWTPGNPAGDGTTNVTGLVAGTWSCTVTDANNCTRTQTFTITQPAALTLTPLSQTNVSCNGGNNGAASVNPASGGAGGYTYNWTPGNPAGDGTTNVTGLIAGTWSCTVMDANSCTRTQTFTITQPSALTLTPLSQTNVSCNGGNNGAASVNPASGGAGGYTYNWTPGNPTGDGTTNVTGLVAGTWSCTVMDANSCTLTQTFTITQPSVLNTATAVTNVSCFGNSTGSATVTASGGSGAYTYLWSSAQTTSVISGLNAGLRTVTVTDGNGCTATNTVVITQPGSALATATAVTNVLCFGNSTGSATVTASGGSGAYTYLWSSAQTTSVISSLNAGVRTVTVTDGNGCTATNTVTITQPASGIITTTAVTNVLCNGGSTGSATVTASGGAGAYTYLWSSAQTTSVISGLNAGVRTVTVTDAGGCTATNTVIVTQPPVLNTATAVTNVSCFGNSTGSATVTVSGGSGAYTYLWSSAQTTSVISGLNAGVRTVTVTDGNGCTAINTAVITQPGSALATATAVTNVLCFGNSTGSATVTASGGSGAYTYLWSSAQTTSVISSLNAGVRTVTVTDGNGCTATNTVTITQPASGIITTTAVTNVLCNGGSTGSATVTASGGAGAYTYLWSSAQTTSVIIGLNTGVRTVTVTDGNGCTATNTVVITQPAALTVTVSPPSLTLCSGNSGTLTGSAGGGTGVISYSWSTGATNSVIVVSPIVNTNYTLVATDANTCSVSAVRVVTVNTTPTVSALSGSICSGQSFTITPSGAATYTYSGGSAVVSPATTSSYSVTGTSAQGCVSINTAVVTVSVNAIPVISASSQTICT